MATPPITKTSLGNPLGNSTSYKNYPSNQEELQHFVRFGFVKFRDRKNFTYNAGPADTDFAGAKVVNLDTVYLPMPDNLQIGYGQNWDVVDMDIAGAVLHRWNAGKEVVNSVSGLGTENTSAELMKKAYDATEGLGQYALRKSIQTVFGTNDFTDAFDLQRGRTFNPFKETLYRGVSNRSFTFSWNLYPRNQADCDNILSIIKTFKSHSAPGLVDDTILFEYPDEFTIDFYVNKQETPYLPKIGFCVCTGIETNYTSAGLFAALKNGHPVDVQFTANFTEVEIVTKDKVEQGY